MSILVCIPTAGDIHAETTEAAFRLCATFPGGAEFRAVRAAPTDHCRNECVKLFLNSAHSHLFFLDSDVVPPNNTLELLIGAGRPIACGIYPLLLAHVTICSSVAMVSGEDGGRKSYEFVGAFGEEPFEVDAGGMGCCLIQREVFEKMEFPWYKFEQAEDCKLRGEDIYFFEKAADLGFKPLVIPQALCSHLKSVDLLDLVKAVQHARTQAAVPVGMSN